MGVLGDVLPNHKLFFCKVGRRGFSIFQPLGPELSLESAFQVTESQRVYAVPNERPKNKLPWTTGVTPNLKIKKIAVLNTLNP